jgi:hypothetical protein
MAHRLRIQRKRTKGWRMPPGAVYVGRPTMWGNPFDTADDFRRVAELIASNSCATVKESGVSAIAFWAIWSMIENIELLRDRPAACWCSLDHPCHGDVLCELANR